MKISELTKAKLMLILAVMVVFTIVNVINDNNWFGYFLSLFVFPIFTWITIEICLKMKK